MEAQTAEAIYARARAFKGAGGWTREEARVAREVADPRIKHYLRAMRATGVVPVGTRGLWRVRIHRITEQEALVNILAGNPPVIPGPYTQLLRATLETMHLEGECVMNDYPCELRTHLQAVMRAHGRVLVTGLGLGCVVRGMLQNPRVTHIDVVERDLDVIRLVWDSVRTPRVTLYHRDALRLVEEAQPGRWDFAWHDIWSDPDAGERHLDVLHGQLMRKLYGKVPVQGAWRMDRRYKKMAARVFDLAG